MFYYFQQSNLNFPAEKHNYGYYAIVDVFMTQWVQKRRLPLRRRVRATGKSPV